MTSKVFKATIVREGSTCFVPIPFDAKAAFGVVRAPVKVTLNGYTYRSTIFSMGERVFVPLRKSHREAAGIDGGETIEVRIELDTDKREITPPDDLLRAIRAEPTAWARWQELSYTHQREHVEAIEQAKKQETRARRVETAVRMVAARPPKKQK